MSRTVGPASAELHSSKPVESSSSDLPNSCPLWLRENTKYSVTNNSGVKSLYEELLNHNKETLASIILDLAEMVINLENSSQSPSSRQNQISGRQSEEARSDRSSRESSSVTSPVVYSENGFAGHSADSEPPELPKDGYISDPETIGQLVVSPKQQHQEQQQPEVVQPVAAVAAAANMIASIGSALKQQQNIGSSSALFHQLLLPQQQQPFITSSSSSLSSSSISRNRTPPPKSNQQQQSPSDAGKTLLALVQGTTQQATAPATTSTTQTSVSLFHSYRFIYRRYQFATQ